MKISKHFALILALVACETLYGARPMNTDDARVVAPQSCQIESWAKFGGGSEFWALPACNFLLDTEMTIGGNLTQQDSVDSINGGNSVYRGAAVFALKKIFKDLERDGFSYGLSVGNARMGRFLRYNESFYTYALLSKAFFDNQLFLHTNLGYKAAGREHLYTFGLGVEYDMNERIWLMAEGFKERFVPALYQVGIRIWLKRDMVQIDCTYGNAFAQPFGRSMAFGSVGIRVLSEKLF
ncbi:hypothetical protein [uncultured Helicobacter sp.]|uniref:hypothetical protein n=1 Tax=uncultured Helicobacter sp. TaxID=175537 RepID=UPI00374FF1B5